MIDRIPKVVPAAQTVQTKMALFDFAHIMGNAVWDVNEII